MALPEILTQNVVLDTLLGLYKMKKYLLSFCFILIAINVWPIKKSCNYLNQIPYGTSFDNVKLVLGEHSSKQIIDKQAKIYRCIFVLCRFNSTVTTDVYYLTFENDSLIERGVCDKDAKVFIKIPFDVKFSESLDNLENAKQWSTSYYHQVEGDEFVSEKKKKNIIEAIIPGYLNIKDKVFFVNNSTTPILKAVFVNSTDYTQVLGICDFVGPGKTVQIADFTDNGLSLWRGLPIDIKIKGYANQGLDANVLEEELDSNLFTYDFVVYFYAENHDLYISALSDTKVKKSNILDF